MNPFVDGRYVWLRSRERRMYLHADEDGRGVSLHKHWGSHNTAWLVHRFHGAGDRVLLQSAAYGRYLSATDMPALRGHHGLRTELRDFPSEEMSEAITWQFVRRARSRNTFTLINVTPSASRYLRANGRYFRCHRGVTIEDTNKSTMMYWCIKLITRRYAVPPIPPAIPPVEEEQDRTVSYVQADPNGNIIEADWAEFLFTGRSVANLRNQLSEMVNGESEYCYRAGACARFAPILVDLPCNNEPINVVIIRHDTPAFAELQHPNVDINPASYCSLQ